MLQKSSERGLTSALDGPKCSCLLTLSQTWPSAHTDGWYHLFDDWQKQQLHSRLTFSQKVHTNVAFVGRKTADTQKHVCCMSSVVGEKQENCFAVFLHIYWTNNTAEYMLNCVCVWKVTELLLADWRRSLAERQEPVQASTLQPVQH